jgi:valyl-tRNA synthetase
MPASRESSALVQRMWRQHHLSMHDTYACHRCGGLPRLQGVWGKQVATGGKRRVLTGCPVQDAAAAEVLRSGTRIVQALVPQCRSLEVLPADSPAPSGAAVAILDTNTTLYLHLKGLLDPSAELEKLRKAKEGAQSRLGALLQRMGMPAYANTPEDRKAVDDDKQKELQAEVANIDTLIAEMQALAN